MRHLHFLWLFTAIIFIGGGALAQVADTAPLLTLDAAIQRALTQSPRLKSADASVRAKKGERQQAGAIPNPQIGVEVDDIQGTNSYRGFRSAEVTYGISQTVEIGGKRGSRVNVAEQAVTLGRYDYQAERLNLIRDVMVAYAEAVAAEKQFSLASEQKKLAEDVYQEVNERVTAAREPLIQRSKAEVTRATSNIAYEKARREVENAKRKLATLWGETSTEARLDETALFQIEKPDELYDAEAGLINNPDAVRWETEIKRSQAALDLEKANAIPDPNFNVGIKDFRNTGDRAFLVGVSIPIPIFNANGGNIAKARHEASKANTDKVIARLQLKTELTQRHQDLATAYGQAQSLKDSILPSAEKAFSLSREGYRAGKFSYLEVLDAQRTLFETKGQYIIALQDYQKAKAEIDRLTAKYLDNTMTDEADDE